MSTSPEELQITYLIAVGSSWDYIYATSAYTETHVEREAATTVVKEWINAFSYNEYANYLHKHHPFLQICERIRRSIAISNPSKDILWALENDKNNPELVCDPQTVLIAGSLAIVKSLSPEQASKTLQTFRQVLIMHYHGFITKCENYPDEIEKFGESKVAGALLFTLLGIQFDPEKLTQILKTLYNPTDKKLTGKSRNSKIIF